MSTVHELQDAAVTLIAELPDDAGDMKFSHVRRIRHLHVKIAEAMAASSEHSQTMLDRVALRGLPPDAPIIDCLTGDEIAVWERSERRMLDADRATAAIEGWAERSGYSRIPGLDPRPEPLPMLMLEDPVGGSVLHEADDEEATT